MPSLATGEVRYFQDKLKVIVSPKAQQEKPELLVWSGVHGDEDESIPPLWLVLSEYQALLPAFLFIPAMSPSAIKAHTRRMFIGEELGPDMNRSFDLNPAPRETQLVKDFLQQHGPFERILSVHEDEDLTDHTYVYFEGEPVLRQTLQDWRDAVRLSGHQLHNGYDDPYDPTLAMWSSDGHIHHAHSDETTQMSESWAIANKRARQAITLEVPMQGSPETKYQLIKAALKLVMIGS